MSGAAVQQMVLRDEQERALVPASEHSEFLQTFERLASNPAVSAEVLRELWQVKKEMLALDAKAAFDAAFTEMRPKLPVIMERKQGDKWKYAPREDIVEIVTPILHAHGFALSHETDWTPDGSQAIVITYLKHVRGHREKSKFVSPSDNSGSKNAVQGRGSVIEYGKRYGTEDVLGLVTRDMDDNARRVGRPEPPAGFEAWYHDLQATAETGYPALESAWKQSDPKYRNYVMAHFKTEHEALKEKARKVKP